MNKQIRLAAINLFRGLHGESSPPGLVDLAPAPYPLDSEQDNADVFHVLRHFLVGVRAVRRRDNASRWHLCDSLSPQAPSRAMVSHNGVADSVSASRESQTGGYVLFWLSGASSSEFCHQPVRPSIACWRRPLDWRIAQSGDADPTGESTFNGRLHKIGRNEGKRYCHVDLAYAAPFALRDAFDAGFCIIDKLVEPPASPGDRRDQGRARFRADGTSVLGIEGVRQKDLTAPL